MRIISGKWKGRILHTPSKKWPVRPTTDFAREALFNILDNRLDYPNTIALDLFGGTGIHSVELASRGCENVTYVDIYRDSALFMKSLVKEWTLPVQVIQGDVFSFLKKATMSWNYIFADPPYDLKELDDLVHLITTSGVLSKDGLFVLEHSAKRKFEHVPEFKEHRIYGQTMFSFFAPGL